MAEPPKPTDAMADALDENSGQESQSIDEDAQFQDMVASIVERDRELIDRLAH